MFSKINHTGKGLAHHAKNPSFIFLNVKQYSSMKQRILLNKHKDKKKKTKKKGKKQKKKEKKKKA